MSDRKNEVGILVLGGHVQALTIVRIAGYNNIPCAVSSNDKLCLARYSKYCSKFYHYTSPELLDRLIEIGESNLHRNWVVFPTNDYQVQILSKNKKKLEQYFTLAVDDWEKASIFWSKKQTYRLAKKNQVPIPKTFTPTDIEEIGSIDINFPCIIKPDVMHIFRSKYGVKVLKCSSRDELISNYQKIKSEVPDLELIVQEIIDGSYDNQYSVGILCINNRIVTHIVAKRARQHPINFGNATTFAYSANIPEILQYAKKIIENSGFTGICEVEFMYDAKSSEYKLLEVNPRTWKWHGIQIPANTPFVLNYFNYLVNKQIPEFNSTEKPATWRHITVDLSIFILMLLKGLNPFRHSKQKVKHKHRFAVLNIKDLKPFLMELLLIPHIILTRK
ncbi:MAG: ATP-grasp domain-containing protein [Bacteroidales bacterium]|nr:ATP-grasp domain-containing protein [Bacteroidales bacterium]